MQNAKLREGKPLPYGRDRVCLFVNSKCTMQNAKCKINTSSVGRAATFPSRGRLWMRQSRLIQNEQSEPNKRAIKWAFPLRGRCHQKVTDEVFLSACHFATQYVLCGQPRKSTPTKNAKLKIVKTHLFSLSKKVCWLFYIIMLEYKYNKTQGVRGWGESRERVVVALLA